MSEKIALIACEPPYNKNRTFTAARVALAAQMEEDIDATLVLMEDGVYAGMKDQKSEQFLTTGSIIRDFMDLGGKVLVCGMCIKERGIPESELIEGCEIIDIHRLIATIHESDKVLYF
ncbi:DsrE family protein [Methermicoccus shengliensis]|uniref:DsrE family protein n=1 Tax=Methermicoccus shengliensis TaxID=660064 RepID=A0A832VMW2_9EURY|nr:DsrE family protein [Methermicoccus shengliensis]HIH69706.1 DsrE family protein [Methermicoccus shengliensis]